MKVERSQHVEQRPVEMEGAERCRVRWLVDAHDGAPTFAMREFEVAPGGHTPRHHHPYEHEIYVLEGDGEIFENDTPHPLKKGDVIYVAPDEVHQFRNTGDSPLKFLCLVPNAAGQGPGPGPECGLPQEPTQD